MSPATNPPRQNLVSQTALHLIKCNYCSAILTASGAGWQNTTTSAADSAICVLYSSVVPVVSCCCWNRSVFFDVTHRLNKKILHMDQVDKHVFNMIMVIIFFLRAYFQNFVQLKVYHMKFCLLSFSHVLYFESKMCQFSACTRFTNVPPSV